MTPAPDYRKNFCGRLVFLNDYKSGTQYLGLVSCGSYKPYIFSVRPRDLYSYYWLVNAKIANGASIYVENYGEIHTYITTFETYEPIDDCKACGSGGGGESAPAATPTPGFVFPTATQANPASMGMVYSAPTQGVYNMLRADQLLTTQEIASSTPASITIEMQPAAFPTPTPLPTFKAQASQSSVQAAYMSSPPSSWTSRLLSRDVLAVLGVLCLVTGLAILGTWHFYYR